ncbi:MAG: M6 family metalloprotease domain-containing protein [Candidatus Eisenbacteria bacterium]|nr:M6 family metalloprotease domain-containing protein [Candidatus Eisenbacteria bacterium]
MNAFARSGLAGALGLALWVLSSPVYALTPPVRDGFPEIVRLRAAEGVFAPHPDPGGAPLATLPRRPFAPAASADTARRALVVPTDFADQPSVYSSDSLRWLLFELRSSGPGTGSLRDYYRDVSLNQLDVTGAVHPWIRARYPKNYYAAYHFGLGGLSPTTHNATTLVTEMVQALDSLGVDFSPYDVNGDGYVDALWIVHSGQGGEYNMSDGTNIWSHQSSLSAWGLPPYMTHTPWPGHPGQFLQVNRYIVLPEMSSVRPGEFTEIGTYCHEYGHTLGLPDLYSTVGPPYPGVGNWDLMAGGAHGGDGHHPECPSQPGAWTRAWLGWLPPSNVSAEGPVRIEPTETTPASLKLWSDGRPQNEYYLLENRHPLGWDRYLPGGGLLVWHVDDALVAAGLPTNSVQSYPTFGVRVMEADGLGDLYLGVNRGDAGDVYPGYSRNTALDDASVPVSRDNRGANPNVAVRGVRLNSDRSVEAYLAFTPDRWQPAGTVRGPAGTLALSGGAGYTAVTDGSGSLHLLWADDSQGTFHVYCLTRPLGMRWEAAPTQLDQSEGAYTFSVATDADGGLMAAWTQYSGGRSQLVARHRSAGGTWEPQQVLRDGVTISSVPSLTGDSRGLVACAWAERMATVPERVLLMTWSNPVGWNLSPFVLPEDSVTSQPAVVADARDGLHLAYLLKSGVNVGLYHTSRPYGDVAWSRPNGPLALGRLVRQPCIAALDSDCVVVAWRDAGGGKDVIMYRRLNSAIWESPKGPTGTSLGSAWPFSMVSDAASKRLTFVWDSDPGDGMRVMYRDIGLESAWDAGEHVLAGPDSGGASSPGAVRGASGGMAVVWLQNGRVHVRTRLGTVPVGRPPQIVPLPSSPSHLGQSRPNPMNPHAVIPFRVPESGAVLPAGGSAARGAGVPAPAAAAGRVSLAILDVTGRRVRILLDGPRDPGSYEATWDGRLEDGRRAPSGVYFYRLDLGSGRVETRKLLLVR